MKATLGIEAIGWADYQAAREADAGLGCRMFGYPCPAWCAQITGMDMEYGLARKFLRGRVDYSEANSKGSRGVMIWYVLESGNLYEVKERRSWKRTDRYFCAATAAGDIQRIEEGEAIEWARKLGWASTS